VVTRHTSSYAATDRRLTKGRSRWTERAAKKPPLQKGSKSTLSVPEEGLRNGAGSTKHATLARLQKGSGEGKELEASWKQCT